MKAGALFIAVVVSFIIALLCSSFILYSYYINIRFEAIRFQQKVNSNVVSGMQLMLVDGEIVKDNETLILDLFDTGEDSVSLSVYPWGGFHIYKSVAYVNKFSSRQIAMTGYNFFENNETALYLQDLNVPLSIAGSTFLKGNFYLPKSGIKIAYIEGIGYDGDQLLYGTKKISDTKLPGLNENLENNIANMGQLVNSLSGDYINVSDGILPEVFTQSFFDSTVVYYSDNIIIIPGSKISGNVKIVSAKGVIIKKEASLTDVLISAPFVTIEDEFTGALQVFAKDSIKVGKKVTLNYPSVIGIYQPVPQEVNTFIDLGEQSQISGVVLGFTKNPPVDNRLKIMLNKNSIVNGEIYCNSFIDLKGSVFGSVVCSKFILRTPSSVYENHLLNATIDYSRLNPDFIAASLINNHGNKRIVKWLK